MLTLGGCGFFIASVVLGMNLFVSAAPSTAQMVDTINGAVGKQVVSGTVLGPSPNAANSTYLENALPGSGF